MKGRRMMCLHDGIGLSYTALLGGEKNPKCILLQTSGKYSQNQIIKQVFSSVPNLDGNNGCVIDNRSRSWGAH